MINLYKLKECPKVDCSMNENFKICLCLIFTITFIALALIGITLFIEDKQSYEELVKTSKKQSLEMVTGLMEADGVLWKILVS